MKRDDAATPLVPFDEFADFVRRVVSVPKQEIDRRMSAYQRQRAKQKKARPHK
ncbi:MAG: hypothetical protein ABSA52_16745 [Candidatus Binatia bacterium]